MKVTNPINYAYDKSLTYRLVCGHNNGGILNIWPFRTWICFECGTKSDFIHEVKP